MIKINDPVRRMEGKQEKKINAPDGIDFEVGTIKYNIRELDGGILIRKVSFDMSETIIISPTSTNQIIIR